jgi:hypothetical protein
MPCGFTRPGTATWWLSWVVHFQPFQQQQLARSFNTVIIMTDFDKKQFYKECAKCKRAGAKLCKGHNPGEELGASIVQKMRGKRVLWAHCGGSDPIPRGRQGCRGYDGYANPSLHRQRRQQS